MKEKEKRRRKRNPEETLWQLPLPRKHGFLVPSLKESSVGSLEVRAEKGRSQEGSQESLLSFASYASKEQGDLAGCGGSTAWGVSGELSFPLDSSPSLKSGFHWMKCKENPGSGSMREAWLWIPGLKAASGRGRGLCKRMPDGVLCAHLLFFPPLKHCVKTPPPGSLLHCSLGNLLVRLWLV